MKTFAHDLNHSALGSDDRDRLLALPRFDGVLVRMDEKAMAANNHAVAGHLCTAMKLPFKGIFSSQAKSGSILASYVQLDDAGALEAKVWEMGDVMPTVIVVALNLRKDGTIVDPKKADFNSTGYFLSRYFDTGKKIAGQPFKITGDLFLVRPTFNRLPRMRS